MKNLLKVFLDEFDMTRLDFAKKLDVDPTIVYRWLNYSALPSPKNAQRIQKATMGNVPIAFWGYTKDHKGRIVRLARKPLKNFLNNDKEQ